MATQEQPPQIAEGAQPAPAAKTGLKWYAVRTYSGYENKAKKGLEDRIRMEGLQDLFGEILIPTEMVTETGKSGQKRTVRRKFMPGYILVQMVVGDRSVSAVKNTAKVTGFLGTDGTTPPPAVKDEEVKRLTIQITEGAAKPRPRITFEEGNTVRVTEGPFANFQGVVEEVKQEKAKLRVSVSIFGRPTPVELEFNQVEKLS
jgi:transcriptional antiterminator NusG